MLYENTVRLCSRLIQARSYSGEETEAAYVLRAAMKMLHYDEVRVDEYGNVIGCIHGSRPGPTVLLDGHIDTVKVPDPKKWTQDPFGGKIDEDRVWGRGASDMKGAVAAMTCAAAAFRDRCHGDFPGKLCVAGVVYEELFEGVSPRIISRDLKPDFVVIGESTHLNLNIGQRGRGEIVVETYGKAAHSSNPEKGVNAVKQMMKLLAEIEKIRPEEQEGLGKGILEVTDILSEPYPGSSVVPEKCTATLDRRLLVGDTPESVLEPIDKIIEDLSGKDETFRAKAYIRKEKKMCYTRNPIESLRFFPAWKQDKDAPFVKNSYEALKKAGLDPEISCYSFCTNGSHYAGEAGIPTVGFGPSLESLAHTVDEYILKEQLQKCADGYVELADALLHTEK